MSSERIFGTDGVRGRAGEGWLAEDRVSALGRAVGRIHLPHAERPEDGGRPRAVLGHDGRASGPVLQAALARGLHAAGFEVVSAGLISSPGLALLTRTLPFGLGVMLSASHNPAEDNGIKIFSHEGTKLSDEEELEIEALLRRDEHPETTPVDVPVDPALEGHYVDHLIAHAGAGLDLSGLEVVIDCANGSGSRFAPRVLQRLGATVHALHCAPDGTNINRECGSTHPESLQREVLARGARLGIALDGDADRCILVDERGELVHGDGILTVVAREAVRSGCWSDPRVVATVMSNRGLHRALREVGVGVVECAVGDRYVVEALRREALPLGGEQSGHVIFGDDLHYIGDGLYTALRVLAVLRSGEAPLSELAAAYRPYPQVLLNVPVVSRPPLDTLPETAALVARVEQELGDEGRVLLRYSGTESLARVMVEGPDRERIEAQAREIAERLVAEIRDRT
jgi:phosphoglucosamine mutase